MLLIDTTHTAPQRLQYRERMTLMVFQEPELHSLGDLGYLLLAIIATAFIVVPFDWLVLKYWKKEKHKRR